VINESVSLSPQCGILEVARSSPSCKMHRLCPRSAAGASISSQDAILPRLSTLAQEVPPATIRPLRAETYIDHGDALPGCGYAFPRHDLGKHTPSQTQSRRPDTSPDHHPSRGQHQFSRSPPRIGGASAAPQGPLPARRRARCSAEPNGGGGGRRRCRDRAEQPPRQEAGRRPATRGRWVCQGRRGT